MSEESPEQTVAKQQRDQMLKLVTKAFYNELIKYGVQEDEILRAASHLLDNVLAPEGGPGEGIQYYNQLFTLESVKDEWQERQQLAVQHVTLRDRKSVV